ncbi:hypothetical protein BC832DRAFT_592416 [Gaertneriomyces semiglobifer]|nr:hypothetical protein BC832DRAFT_592416 [Gaertneriomyces semiglobifer]
MTMKPDDGVEEVRLDMSHLSISDAEGVSQAVELTQTSVVEEINEIHRYLDIVNAHSDRCGNLTIRGLVELGQLTMGDVLTASYGKQSSTATIQKSSEGKPQLYGPNGEMAKSPSGFFRAVFGKKVNDPWGRLLCKDGRSLYQLRRDYQEAMGSRITLNLHSIHPSVWRVEEAGAPNGESWTAFIGRPVTESERKRLVQEHPIFRSPYIHIICKSWPGGHLEGGRRPMLNPVLRFAVTLIYWEPSLYAITAAHIYASILPGAMCSIAHPSLEGTHIECTIHDSFPADNEADVGLLIVSNQGRTNIQPGIPNVDCAILQRSTYQSHFGRRCKSSLRDISQHINESDYIESFEEISTEESGSDTEISTEESGSDSESEDDDHELDALDPRLFDRNSLRNIMRDRQVIVFKKGAASGLQAGILSKYRHSDSFLAGPSGDAKGSGCKSYQELIEVQWLSQSTLALNSDGWSMKARNIAFAESADCGSLYWIEIDGWLLPVALHVASRNTFSYGIVISHVFKTIAKELKRPLFLC